MKKVLTFGSFDPLHEGHRQAFLQSRAHGEYLIVVVARDSTIVQQKQRQPQVGEKERLQAVAGAEAVDEARLGEVEPEDYALLRELDFDVLALGYDQTPSDEEARRRLHAAGKEQVTLIRLEPYKPELFKSKYLRT